MERIQAGDESALGALLDRYSRLVLGIGLRTLRDHGEAQELVQDVFLHVYRKRGGCCVGRVRAEDEVILVRDG